MMRNSVEQIREGILQGDLNLVQDIISAQPHLKDKCDEDLRTPFHWACSAGHITIAKWLINMNANALTVDEAGWTPLMSASASGRTDTVKWLLDNDLCENPPITTTKHTKSTPLHFAASRGHTDIVRLLVRAGASLTAKDANGHIPLAKAICNSHEETVRYLIDQMQSSDYLDWIEDATGENLLHLAVNNHDIEIGAILFQRSHGELAKRLNKREKSPADLASRGELLRWKELMD